MLGDHSAGASRLEHRGFPTISSVFVSWRLSIEEHTMCLLSSVISSRLDVGADLILFQFITLQIMITNDVNIAP